MSTRFTVSALTAVLLASGTALAQTPPAAPNAPAGPDRAEMQRHFVEVCRDRVARVTGEMAYLETRLALSDAQRPLFERWKRIKLNAARAADCTPPPEGRPTVVDVMKGEQKRLQQRLEELRGELPALEALFASLNDEQKHAFAPPHRPPPQGDRHEGRPGGGPNGAPGGHPGGGPGGGPSGDNPQAGAGEPPPPPEH
jgi:hypothetical protein